MSLIFNGYFKAKAIRIAAAFGALLALSACIESETPVLTDAKPLLGERVRLRIYSLRESGAYDPQAVRFRWDGSRYVNAGGSKDFTNFTLHAFEGADLIAQNFGKKIEYGLVRKLASGVFLVIPIDESDADEATRTKFCRKLGGSSCRVESKDDLFAFARVTAAKPQDHGGLVIQLGAKQRP
jgi:hypothetical protein